MFEIPDAIELLDEDFDDLSFPEARALCEAAGVWLGDPCECYEMTTAARGG